MTAPRILRGVAALPIGPGRGRPGSSSWPRSHGSSTVNEGIIPQGAAGYRVIVMATPQIESFWTGIEPGPYQRAALGNAALLWDRARNAGQG